MSAKIQGTMDKWTPGHRVGPYELLARIGAGGMGEVWKARDARLGRTVAIKRIKSEHAGRFDKEARAIAALNHSNICQIYDVGPDYLVMEYIDGSVLSCPAPPPTALALAVQIISGLEEAHRHGIIHRDLKPGNIMVTREGVAKLLDFGLAKFAGGTYADVTGTVTAEGTIVGTAAYMSPEQVEGKVLDERSDVFSFGAILYELLSGRRCFSGESTVQVMSAVLRDDPAPIGGPLAHVVTRCLAKRPADRFQTVTELKKALQKQMAAATGAEASIAVLPFADMSPAQDNEYFSDGLAEEIINALAQISGLKVIARTSAFSFKGQNTDIRHIAEALGVTNILEGSVRRAGERIRVTAQLITAADGSHLWSQRYDREMTDVFAIQDEIAQAIADALRVKLSRMPHTTPRRYTPNLAAYEAFLKGRHHWSKMRPESFEKSRESYEQAIALDPKFALAESFLGEHYFVLASGLLQSPPEMMQQARLHAQRALEIDPSIPEARVVLALVGATYDYDWEEVERQFRLAMASEPVTPYARMFNADYYLIPMGRTGEAVSEGQVALEADPLNLLCRLLLVHSLISDGRDDDAIAQIQQMLEIDPNYYMAYAERALIEAGRGNVHHALADAERAHSLAPWFAPGLGLLAGISARSGDVRRAESLLAGHSDPRTYETPIVRVLYSFAFGDMENAAEWLEHAFVQRNPQALTFLRPRLLQSTARWPRLMRLANLL
jgi:serine/threonine-protein kinase